MARQMIIPFSPTGDDEDADLQTLVDKLNGDLANEGYVFELTDRRIGQGFRRVYVSHGGGMGYGEYNLYLDLRMGMLSPRGRTIEMMTGKPGTYGIPGFARHVAGASDISAPYDTFKDYVRSVFEFSATEGKKPDEVKWTVYQEGFEGRQLPAAEEFGAEGYETSFFPKAGGILTRSSSQAQRAFIAAAVRPYYGNQEPRDYVAGVVKQMKAGTGAPLGLYGYVPTENYGWAPGGTSYIEEENLVRDEPAIKIGLPRTPAGAAKSKTSWTGARNMADVPLVKDPTTGRLVRVQPSQPTKGWGYRRGWTLASGPIATETEPRMVFSAQVAAVDMPDMPGAMVASRGAFDFYGKTGIKPTPGKSPKLTTYAIGEGGEGMYEFGVDTVDEFWDLVDKQKLKFFDVQGKEVKPGSGKFSLGHYWVPGDEGKPGRWKDVYIDKRSYPMSLNKPTLHIPEFYDPNIEGGGFSNLPITKPGGGVSRTDKLVRQLRQKYGDSVNIVQWSGVGTGGTEAPAAVYLTYDFERVTPVSAKGGRSFKAEVAQKDYDYSLEMVGKEGEQTPVDFMTAETKIPSAMVLGSFQTMNMKTQQNFVSLFLPGFRSGDTPEQRTANRAIQNYIKWAYDNPLKSGRISVDPNRMASIWNEATGDELSADTLFKMVTDNILDVNDRRKQITYGKRFGIFWPTDQMAAGNVYSPSSKREFDRLLSKLDPADTANITWQQYTSPFSPLTSADLRVPKSIDERVQSELHRMFFKVKGGGNSLVMQSAIDFVPEYQSDSGFMNSKAIMGLIENYPEAAQEIGLMEEKGKWAGVFSPEAYKKGVPDPASAAAEIMMPYLQFQKRLSGGGETVPGDAVGMSPRLAKDISDLIERARSEAKGNNKAQLEIIEQGMKGLNAGVEFYGLKAGTKLEESWFLDPNSGTLAPKIGAVIGLESYQQGIKEGVTQTWIGDNYIRLLDAMTQSATSEPGAMMSVIGGARERFYGRINAYFYPEGHRSKQMFRHLTGMTLPGTRGGRYQGMTELESGEAFASDSYIIRALAAGGFRNARQIRSILNYLGDTPDAFLPILSQRFPDVSGNTVFMPIKLRSKKHLASLGIPIPDKGPNSEDLIYISDMVNRFQVGDFDADPYMMKILPIFQSKDPKTGKLIDEWSMTDKTSDEFRRKYTALYNSDVDSVGKTNLDRALEDMFGPMGTSASGDSLDVSRKTLADYMKAQRTVGFIRSRNAEAGDYPVEDVLNAYTASFEYQAGKGVSYIARTEVMDIAAAVMGMSGKSVDIYKKAYESMALPYQLYLDLNKRMVGGFTQLETLLNTYGIYGVNKQKNQTFYRLSYKLTNQGKPIEFDPNQWGRPGGQGMQANTGMLINKLMSSTADMPSELMTNEMLASGWSTPGNDEVVLKALQDPAAFWKSLPSSGGYASTLSADTIKSRARVMSELYDQGKVGWNSNYYMALTYRAIERLRRKTLSNISDERIQLPWINGQMMSVRDIVETPDFQKWDLAENLFVRGAEALTPEHMERLNRIGGFRMAGMLAGMYQDWKSATGGIMEQTAAEQEYGTRLKDAFKIWQESKMSRTPIVHASELGSMLAPPRALQREDWKAAEDYESAETQYRLALSTMGFPFLMTGRDKPGTHFRRTSWIAGGESLIDAGAIGGGIAFEREYSYQHPELMHLGRVPEQGVIKYQLGGLEMHGTPDFVTVDANGNVVILDTKSPAPSANVPYTQGYAEAKAKKYRYRIQQLSYAYGLQSMARDKNIDAAGWEEIMQSWNIRDKSLGRAIRQGAAAGKFKLYIQPGRYTTDTGLEEFNKIEIPFNQDTKMELEEYGKAVEKYMLTKSMFGEVAQKTYEALSEGRVPEALAGGFTFTSKHVDLDLFAGLEQYAKNYYKPPRGSARAAGGGRFPRGSRMRVRVGEGGPEELLIGPEGVEIVPQYESSEARAGRGELDPLEGYIGERAAFGFTPINPQGGGGGRRRTPPPNNPPVPPVPPNPPPNPANTPILTRDDLIAAFQAAVGEGITVTAQFQGRHVEPEPGAFGAQVRSLANVMELDRPAVGRFQQGIQRVLSDWFTSQGKEGMIQGMMGLPSSGEMISLAIGEGMTREELISGVQRQPGLLPSAKRVSNLMKKQSKLFNIVQRAGGWGEIQGLLGIGSAEAEQFGRLEQLFTDTGLPVRAPSPNAPADQWGNVGAAYRQAIEQTGAAAETVMNYKTDITAQERAAKKDITASGASDARIEAYWRSVDKLTEAHEKYNAALAKGTDAHKESFEVTKARLQVDLQEIQARREVTQKAAGRAFAGGRRLSREELTAQGIELTPEERTASQAEADLEEAEIKKQEQIRKTQPTTARGRAMERIAGFGRRMLGGFGLMYMQSIAGMIGGKAMEGYPEAMEGMMMQQQLMGQAIGGFESVQTVESRIAQAKRMQGGLGGFGIRGMYANILENPAASMAMGLGVTGLSAASFGMFGAASLGLGGAAIAGVGALAAGIAVPTILGLGTVGAMGQPEGSAASLWAQAYKGREGLSWAYLGQQLEMKAYEKYGGRTGGIIEKQALLGQMMQSAYMQPGIGFEQIKQQQGWTREQYESAVRMYSEALAKSYQAQPQFTYQAVQLGQMYNIPLQQMYSGMPGMEQLAGVLQQGVPIEALGQAIGYSPYRTGAEQRRFAGQYMAQYVKTEGLSAQAAQATLQGADFLKTLGIMAPKPTTWTEYIPRHFEQLPERMVQSEPPPLVAAVQWLTGGAFPKNFPTEVKAPAENVFVPSQFVEHQEGWQAYLQSLGEGLSPAQQAIIQETTSIQLRKRQLGLEYTPAEGPGGTIEQGRNMTQEQMDFQMRMNRVDQLMVDMLDRLESTFIQLGDVLPNMAQFQGMTLGQQGFILGAGQAGQQLEQTLLGGGRSQQQAQTAGRWLTNLAAANPQLYTRMQGVMSGDVREMVAMMQKYPEMGTQIWNQTITGVGGTEIPVSNLNFAAGLTGPGGGLSGLSWGRANLETPRWSGQQVAQMIWGPQSGWESRGYNADIINQMIGGGTRAVEIAQARLGFQYQQAQAGMQMEQIQLQKWYMPQQFALQERGRQLSYAQTEWGLQQQGQQLALSQQNFAFQTGMQQRQMTLQRGWTQEDWGYNAQVRGLQWGWRQEDYAENLRFMTGRDRRLAERQMGRETTLHDLESEQIEKQKGRQKELWAMEDERFTQQVGYQTELFRMQEENLAKQEEFYQQNRQLQEDSADLQEEYWNRSIALQEKAAGIAAGYAARQEELYETMLPFNTLLEDLNGLYSLINKESGADFTDMIRGLDPALLGANSKLGDLLSWLEQLTGIQIPDNGGGGGDGGGNWTYYCAEHEYGTNNVQDWINHYKNQHNGQTPPMQHGGRVLPGMAYLVGERGIELFQPDVSGVIKPRDPWGTTYTTDYGGGGSNGSPQMLHLQVFVGDEKLIDKVIDAVDQKVSE